MRTTTTIAITSTNTADREMTCHLLGESVKLTQALLHLDGGDVNITTPLGDAAVSVVRGEPK